MPAAIPYDSPTGPLAGDPPPADRAEAAAVGLTSRTAGVNLTSAWTDYSGKGVRIAVIDDGFDYAHPDLAPNYDQALDRDFAQNDADAQPVLAEDRHGTAVMGFAGAAQNGSGQVGAAPQATLIGVRIGFGAAWDQLATDAALAYAVRNADVINTSWGVSNQFLDDFRNPATAGLQQGYIDAATIGRGGLGTVIVTSAGNGRPLSDDVNTHNYKNAPQVIAVAGTDGNGNAGWFSTPGAALLVSAPGTGVLAVDRLGAAGYGPGDSATLTGTSYAAPTVAGIVGLMFEANRSLGYRDVQEILAMTAIKSGTTAKWVENNAVNWNGGGMHFSNDLGFGLANGTAAVRLAESWQGRQVAGNLQQISVSVTRDEALEDGGSMASSVVFAQPGRIGTLDRVMVDLDIAHARASDLIVTLTSPLGTVMTLLSRALVPGTQGLRFETAATGFWGENPLGTWTLAVTDAVLGVAGTLRSWVLTLLGDTATADDLYVYTDEFISHWSEARGILADTDGGSDTLNLAAVTRDVSLDLGGAVQSMIGTRSLTIVAGTVIEDVYLGDGDDTLTGNHADNRLHGGRGDDVIAGGAGRDVLTGGRGADRLTGGAGADTFAYSALSEAGDVITDLSRAAGDRIAVSDLLASLGYSGDDAVADGWLRLRDGGEGEGVWFVVDADGFGTGAGTDLVYLAGISGGTRIADLLSGTPSGPVTGPDDRIVITDPFVTGWTAALSVISDTDGGTDTLDLGNVTYTASVNLNAGTASRVGGRTLAISAGTEIENLWLGSGNDRGTGTPDDNRISGGAGNDLLFGGGGNDVLFGNSGSDRLDGGSGSDRLTGGQGADILTGRAGADVFVFTALSDAGDTISDYSRAEGDRVETSALLSELGYLGEDAFADGVLYLREGRGGAWLVADADGNGGDDGIDLVFLAGVTASQQQALDIKASANSVYRMTDAFVTGLGATVSSISDRDHGYDTLDLSGVTADVVLNLNGGTTSRVGAATVQIDPWSRIEKAVLGAGDDQVTGNGSANHIDGGAGRDRIAAGAGHDVIIGGAGADHLTGGSGADVFVFRSMADAGDTIADFALAGRDRLDVSGVTAAFGLTAAAALAAGNLYLRAVQDGAWLVADADGAGSLAGADIALLLGIGAQPLPAVWLL